ncbi:MAG: AraC family transcriptional regulator ligand-binding domain-containing protein [Moraxellaceae bacterium]|nr:AraC family transcriptional regulator ligand-binding domain-containing protein [Moraxellaceae bacterium]
MPRSDPYQLTRPSISIAYLQLLVEILGERGISAPLLLEGMPLDPALLTQPQARMTPQQWTLLILRALALTGDAGLGYVYGLRMRPTLHGVLGYATMSCATLRQAHEVSARYMRVRQAGFTLHVTEAGDYAFIEIKERYPIPVLRSFFHENVLLGLARGIAVLLGRELESLHDLEIWVDWPEPDYHAAWAARLPAMRFARPATLLRLPRHYLDLRPVLADPLASQQAIALCERELALASDNEADITTRVRAELRRRDDAGYPGLDAVAARLCISARTLKRQLQTQGTSFLLLLEEVRRRDAHDLLEHSELPMQQIAAQLGYVNPANFTRAFRQWTGESPSRYRARLRGES